ncbi:MAG: hypothetical protein CMC04_07670 [Flavobacteriaceae bacterium]|nr:hypothetical protein [Flavobacteriaceae bacterium]|tara:strand:+ start:22027 stop:23337 length:1311 start_codon:yes stop_codon:yes gene_type:complete
MGNILTTYLSDIFLKLSDLKIRYAVLRGYENLPYEVSHDIDFGVHPDEIDLMIIQLQDISIKHGFKTVYMSERMGIKQVFFYKQGYCLKIDLWYDFSYKGLKYLDINSILRKTKYHNGIKVLKEDAEVLISFIKEFLHNKKIRTDKIEILKNKLQKSCFEGFESLYLSENNFRDFSSYILQSKMDLKVESRRFVKTLFFKNLKINGFFKTMNNLMIYIYKFLKDALKKKGFFIVIIGPDGSGKTTISKLILDEVKNKKSRFEKKYYLHGRFGIIPNLSRIKGIKENTKQISFKKTDGEESLNHSKSRIFIYMLYYLADFLLGRMILIKLKYSNTIIVADRFYYDYFYQDSFNNYPIFMKNLYKLLAPKPDLFVYLNANPEKIYIRKPELTVERIKLQQKRIEKLLNEKMFFKKSLKVQTNENPIYTYLTIMKNIFS